MIIRVNTKNNFVGQRLIRLWQKFSSCITSKYQLLFLFV